MQHTAFHIFQQRFSAI